MASRAKKPKPKPAKSNGANHFVIGLGIGLVLVSGFIFAQLFHDPLSQEVGYLIRQTSDSKEALAPPNTEFALVIDKIGAVAPIIREVDPLDPRIYQRALKDGVAHAQGTSLPGEKGNIFLFAHSSADLLTATSYNSVFYLLHHLEEGDEIKLYYQDREYRYLVTAKAKVDATAVSYLQNGSKEPTLTLMTCWPPGTTYKRLVVIAKPL